MTGYGVQIVQKIKRAPFSSPRSISCIFYEFHDTLREYSLPVKCRSKSSRRATLISERHFSRSATFDGAPFPQASFCKRHFSERHSCRRYFSGATLYIADYESFQYFSMPYLSTNVQTENSRSPVTRYQLAALFGTAVQSY